MSAEARITDSGSYGVYITWHGGMKGWKVLHYVAGLPERIKLEADLKSVGLSLSDIPGWEKYAQKNKVGVA